jgi:hypothetical protein
VSKKLEGKSSHGLVYGLNEILKKQARLTKVNNVS